MNRETVAFGCVLALSVLATDLLPGLLGLPPSVVQERLLLALAPVFAVFVWWTA